MHSIFSIFSAKSIFFTYHPGDQYVARPIIPNSLKAILSRLCFLFKSHATAGVDDDILESTVLDFVRDILSAFKYVATEMCGSHVLRSIICLLAGIPVISERKGKTSKHQHSVSLAEPLEKLLQADGYHIDSRVSFGVPVAFQGKIVSNIYLLWSARDVYLMVQKHYSKLPRVF